ncbi:MAG: hypothetical protein IT163_10000 [Bryobacterales bacterium]|nr:hypothetical protein [Bryobacterales bacterium]
MSCMASAGLLVLRGCGQPAAGACPQCGRELCVMHLAGGMCPDCMGLSGQFGESEAGRDAASRQNYYNTYGAGNEYGAANYFKQGDRAAVRPGAGLAPPGQDDYDPFDT